MGRVWGTAATGTCAARSCSQRSSRESEPSMVSTHRSPPSRTTWDARAKRQRWAGGVGVWVSVDSWVCVCEYFRLAPLLPSQQPRALCVKHPRPLCCRASVALGFRETGHGSGRSRRQVAAPLSRGTNARTCTGGEPVRVLRTGSPPFSPGSTPVQPGENGPKMVIHWGVPGGWGKGPSCQGVHTGFRRGGEGERQHWRSLRPVWVSSAGVAGE